MDRSTDGSEAVMRSSSTEQNGVHVSFVFLTFYSDR
jgi:hypothetical protein